MALAIGSYERSAKRLPASLGEILALPGCLDESGKAVACPADGMIAGHKFSAPVLRPDQIQLVLEPVAPGITGSENIILQVVQITDGTSNTIIFAEAYGAAAGTRKMYSDLMASGAKAIASLTMMLPYIEQDNVYKSTVPFLQSADPSVDSELRAFAQADGSFSLNSIHTGGANFAFGDGSVRTVVQQFTDDAFRAMQVGAGHENWTKLGGYQPGRSSQGLLLSKNVSTPGTLFNFGDLTQLTDAGVADGKLRTQLLGLVKLASDAAAGGPVAQKDQALADYVSILQKVRGISVPGATADYLSQIARSLQ
jgi:prepilin-type processing-associated H-X9-DG protein